MKRRPPKPTLFPYTTLFRSLQRKDVLLLLHSRPGEVQKGSTKVREREIGDRKSTRLNSSHVEISYAVFCLKKKTGAPGRSNTRTFSPCCTSRSTRCEPMKPA